MKKQLCQIISAAAARLSGSCRNGFSLPASAPALAPGFCRNGISLPAVALALGLCLNGISLPAVALALGLCLNGISITAAAEDTDLDWLVYVYLCGSDLETEYGMATADFQEMMEASLGSRAAFLVETGGAKDWQYDEIDAGVQSRYLITDGEVWLVETKAQANMGESGTLADFLSVGNEYGLTADHVGLVLWDHGSGSINGVCFDENYDYDSLSLAEIGEALAACGETFDFVGFDACLMSTYETANMLSGYAGYMIASEEMEPGYGWDYQALGEAMGENADTETLGKTVCDSFYAACEEIDSEETATLALTDLSAIPQLNDSFDAAAASMVAKLSDAGSLSGIVKGIMKAENYGGNNAAEGYTNMVDLGGILNNISEYVPGADGALEASAVCYRRPYRESEASAIFCRKRCMAAKRKKRKKKKTRRTPAVSAAFCRKHCMTAKRKRKKRKKRNPREQRKRAHIPDLWPFPKSRISMTTGIIRSV